MNDPWIVLKSNWPEPLYGDDITPVDLKTGFEVTGTITVPIGEYESLVGGGQYRPGALYTIAYVWTEGDHDPFYDKPPRGLSRALAWVYACARHAWRENLGLTRPEVRHEVTVHDVRLSVETVSEHR